MAPFDPPPTLTPKHYCFQTLNTAVWMSEIKCDKFESHQDCKGCRELQTQHDCYCQNHLPCTQPEVASGILDSGHC